MIQNKQDRRIALEGAWRKFNRGDEMPLNAVQEILQVDCGQLGKHSQSEGYGIARRAAKYIESETNGHLVIRWDRERNSWRALEANEIPSESTLQLKQIRKKSKANARMCQAAISDGVEGADRDKCVANMALSNAIYAFSSRTVLKKTMGMIHGGVSAITEEAAIEALRSRTS